MLVGTRDGCASRSATPRASPTRVGVTLDECDVGRTKPDARLFAVNVAIEPDVKRCRRRRARTAEERCALIEMYGEFLLRTLLVADLDPFVRHEDRQVLAGLEQRHRLLVDLDGRTVLDGNLLIEDAHASHRAVGFRVEPCRRARSLEVERKRVRTDINAEVVQYRSEVEVEFDDAMATDCFQRNFEQS